MKIILKKEKGAASIAELWVALSIFAIIISAIFAFLIQGTDIFNFSSHQTEAQMQVRPALARINRDFRGAYDFTLSPQGDVLTLRGITVKGEVLQQNSANPRLYRAKHGDWLFDSVELHPTIFRKNGENITPLNEGLDYIISSYEQGEISLLFDPEPEDKFTIDYTYDCYLFYFLDHNSHQLKRILDKNDNGTLDPEESESTEAETLISYIRNYQQNPPVNLFSSTSANTLTVSLIVDKDTIKPPPPYQTQVEIAHRQKSSPEYPPVYPTGWWRFDEGDGNIAYDSSGFNNNGIIYGATWTSDSHIGLALNFDGNDYVSVSGSSLQLKKLTLEVWIKPLTYGGTIVDAYNGYKLNLTSDGKLQGSISRDWSLGSLSATTSQTVPLNQWSHVAMTFDGLYLKLYINGNLSASFTNGKTGDIYKYQGLPSIGKNYGGGGNFNGTIDEVSLYNFAKLNITPY